DCLPAQGEIQGEGRAGAGTALHANLARMFLNDAISDGKTEAGAAGLAFAKRCLGGKEWIVDALAVFGVDARSGVGHADVADLAAAGAREIQQIVHNLRGTESLPCDLFEQP